MPAVDLLTHGVVHTISFIISTDTNFAYQLHLQQLLYKIRLGCLWRFFHIHLLDLFENLAVHFEPVQPGAIVGASVLLSYQSAVGLDFKPLQIRLIFQVVFL